MRSSTHGQVIRGGKRRPPESFPVEVRRACSGPGGRRRPSARPFGGAGRRVSFGLGGGREPPPGGGGRRWAGRWGGPGGGFGWGGGGAEPPPPVDVSATLSCLTSQVASVQVDAPSMPLTITTKYLRRSYPAGGLIT